MVNSVPVRTTDTSINIPHETHTPSLLFPTSLTSWKMLITSLNLMSVGDTTMSTSRMATNRKQSLSPTKDSSNQLWYSLVSVTSLPCSNDSWTICSKTWSLKDGSSSTWMTSSLPLQTLRPTKSEPAMSSNGWLNSTSIWSSKSANSMSLKLSTSGWS